MRKFKTVFFVLLAVAVLAVAGKALAASSLQTTLSTSSVSVGSKVDLTTQIPAVSDTDLSTQEIVQTIDPSKAQLSSAADVIAPAGWTVTYSTDGTTFTATPSSFAAVVKVKATGSVNSLGATADGKQIFSGSASAPGTLATVNGAIRSGGDGFDTEFDSRGYIYNVYHHNAVNGSLDCRKKSDGSFCSANWPFALSTQGFSSNFSSSEFFDEVNKHIWLPVADGSTGTGFLCIDVSNVETPVFCGGSKATAWHMLNSRASAASTGVIDIAAANGNIYTWDILSPKMLCYNYLANSGMGAPCSTAVPSMSHLSAGSTVAANNIPTTYTNIQVAFGNVYGQLNGVATCFNATTMATCSGWAASDLVLGTTTSNRNMYLQPNASGVIVGVCYTDDAKCFAADGTRSTANTTVQAALSNTNVSRWRGSTATSGSKILFTSNWILQSNPSYTYCYDFSTSAACANWATSTAFVTGVGQVTTTNSKTYTLKTDPVSADCMWSNGDIYNGFGVGITQFTVSTGAAGCTLTPSKATFSQSQLQTRLGCSFGADVAYRGFAISGLTAGVDYSSATLAILKSDGTVLASGGTTWKDIAFSSSGFIDLTALSSANLGNGYTFEVSYSNKTSTASTNATLTLESNSAQLCLSVTAIKSCPTTVQIGTPAAQVLSFSATASTTSSSNVRIDYSANSSNLTIAAATASSCGFQLRGQVARGDKATSYPTTVIPVSGAVATLLDSTGAVINDSNSQPITATSDSSGNYSFGYLAAGTYKVRFGDFALSGGIGSGDIAMVYISPFAYQSGSFTMTPQNPVVFTTIQTPLSSPAVSGTAGGADVLVKASYTMRAVAAADTLSIKSGSATTIDVLANDTPTTSATFTSSSLKICAAGTTSACALTSLTVSGQGTYSVSSGKIVFTPVSGFTGAVTPATYQINDNFSNTPQTVSALLTLTVVGPPTLAADTLSGNLLAPITVDVTANDTAASGATLDRSTVKLCAVGTTSTCALISVYVTGKGTYSVNASGVVTFLPDAGFVGSGTAITYSISDSAGNTATSTVTATATATPPVITTSAFPVAAIGQAITADVQTLNAGTASIPATGAWTISAGTLPPGLALNANTGAITGTPTTAGTYNFSVRVTDAGGLTSVKAESITVYAPPTITTTPLTYKFYAGAPATITNTVTAGSGAILAANAWSATGLPAGLTINTVTGVISGTPTATGAFTVNEQVTDVNTLSDTETITINVVSKPVITTNSPLPTAVLGVAITAIPQTKTPGSAAIPATGSWAITAGALPAGLVFNTDTGQITGTPTVSGTFNFTVQLTDAGGEVSTKAESIGVYSPPTIITTPLTYKFYAGAPATITNTVTAGSGAILAANAWSATGLPAGLTINTVTGVISGTPTATGAFTVNEQVTDVNTLSDTETITINVVAKPVITTSSPLANAVAGLAISPIAQTKIVGTASIGSTGAWSIISGALPAGLVLNPDTGAITGTATAVGTYNFTVQLIDTAGEIATKAESIAVITGPTITTNPLSYKLYKAAPGSVANTVTTGSSAVITWSATGLPSGMAINTVTGEISGTPSADGVFTVLERATDFNALFDTETLVITVVTKPVITTSTPLANAVAGQAISAIAQTKTPGSATLPTTGAWSIISGSLPNGLSLNPDTGEITGTATTAGNYTFTLQLIDTAGETATKVETIAVITPPTITTTLLTYLLSLGAPSVVPNSATLGTGTVSAWSASGLPTGMTINAATGAITGTPSVLGTFTVTERLTDVNGLYDEETLTITVASGPVITTMPETYKFGVNNDLGLIVDNIFTNGAAIGASREIVNTATPGAAPIKPTGGWAASGLPAGLSINPDTGKITGAATEVGTFPVTVTVTDTNGISSSKVLTITTTQGPINTTPRVYTYEVDIAKHIGIAPVTIPQTWTLGSAPLSVAKPIPFLTLGTKPAPVTEVNIVTGEIFVLPSLAAYGTYELKTVIVDKNGAFDVATFTINIVKPGSNTTKLTLPLPVALGTNMTSETYALAATSSAGLPITYSAGPPSVCYADSTGQLHIMGVGSCSVTASSGSGKTLSTDTKSFAVTKAHQTVEIVLPGASAHDGRIAPAATDSSAGFKLVANMSSGLPGVFESLTKNICLVEPDGTVTWLSDASVAGKNTCRVHVTQPGDNNFYPLDDSTANTYDIVATHVAESSNPVAPVSNEKPIGVPRAPGTYKQGPWTITITTKKITVLGPVSSGTFIGPVIAVTKIPYTVMVKGKKVNKIQVCTIKFGLLKPFKKNDPLAWKNRITKPTVPCTLNADAFAYYKAGNAVKLTTVVTRDRRWPTTNLNHVGDDGKGKLIPKIISNWKVNIG